MRPILLVLLSFGLAGAGAAKDLFNGKDLNGWELVTNPATDIAAVCQVTKEGALAATGRPVGYLLAAGSYENYRLYLEYRWPVDAAPNSNSGVLVHVASGPIDRHTWPVSLQIQMKINRAGDLLPMAGAKFSETLSSDPGAKTPQLDRLHPSSEKALGEWNAVEITCRGGEIEVRINGILQNKVTQCEPHAGRIGIQLEGAPFELRQLRLTPLE